MFHDFSADFAKTKDTSFVNLNNGTLGLCPDVVIEAQVNELWAAEKNTTKSLDQAFPRVLGIQKSLAELLNGRTEDFFLRPNVTLALNEIIMQMKLAPSSEILATTFEYGAVVNILKYKAQNESLSLRSMSMDFALENPTDDDWVSAIEKELKANTKLFVISHIFTGNGMVAPINKINQMLRSKGILMVVDGAHAPGLIDLDFSQLTDIDYYGGNLHKWIMGPKGTAFGWVNPRLQDQMSPAYGSWTTDIETAKNYGPISAFTARMLWSHSQNFSSYFGLEACFDFWKSQGKDFIQQEIRKRFSYLEDQLSKKGFQALVGSKHKAVFLSYPLDRFAKLSRSQNILESGGLKLQVGLPRLPGTPLLRLTPHIHNSKDELDQAIQVLSSV